MYHSSPFSCGACVVFDDLSPARDTMKRASSSRRSLVISSPPPRSRSTERWTGEKGNGNQKKSLPDDISDAAAVAMALEACAVSAAKENGTITISANAGQRRGHVRAMSDPFDAQHDDDTTQAASSASSILDQVFLPTFPRYPVLETRNKNCWSEPPVDTFHVRGPNYLSDKRKVDSGPYLLQARGCDLFINEKKSTVELLDMYVQTNARFGAWTTSRTGMS